MAKRKTVNAKAFRTMEKRMVNAAKTYAKGVKARSDAEFKRRRAKGMATRRRVRRAIRRRKR